MKIIVYQIFGCARRNPRKIEDVCPPTTFSHHTDALFPELSDPPAPGQPGFAGLVTFSIFALVLRLGSAALVLVKLGGEAPRLGILTKYVVAHRAGGVA